MTSTDFRFPLDIFMYGWRSISKYIPFTECSRNNLKWNVPWSFANKIFCLYFQEAFGACENKLCHMPSAGQLILGSHKGRHLAALYTLFDSYLTMSERPQWAVFFVFCFGHCLLLYWTAARVVNSCSRNGFEICHLAAVAILVIIVWYSIDCILSA